MRRMVLAGILVMATGFTGLLAQKNKDKGQSQQGGQQQQPQLVPNTKSVGESQSVIALVQSQGNPDKIIAAAEDLTTKYTDSFYKETALLMEAQAYRDKRDLEKAQIYAERVLEVNPKNFQATGMLGEILAQRTRENDLDREEKFAQATKYLNDTMENVKTAPKPPQATDAQWDDAKKSVTAEAHNNLGLIAMTRKKYDVAAAEFKTAADLEPEPAYLVRLASALQNQGKSDEAIAICDKLLADANLHPAIRNVAQQVKAAAAKTKK